MQARRLPAAFRFQYKSLTLFPDSYRYRHSRLCKAVRLSKNLFLINKLIILGYEIHRRTVSFSDLSFFCFT